MSVDIEGTKRVRDGLDFTLKPVLDGFVEANMKKKHGVRWIHSASRSSGQDAGDALDTYGLLKSILDNWNDVFGVCFDRKSTHKARRLVSTLFDARNATAHLNVPLSDAEALSYLFAMTEIAGLLKAPQAIQDKLKAAYEGQRGSGRAVSAPAPGEPAPATLNFTGGDALPKPLKPWTDVALLGMTGALGTLGGYIVPEDHASQRALRAVQAASGAWALTCSLETTV